MSFSLRAWACLLLLCTALLAAPFAQAAVDARLVLQLGSEDSDERVDAIRKLAASGEARAEAILKASAPSSKPTARSAMP